MNIFQKKRFLPLGLFSLMLLFPFSVLAQGSDDEVVVSGFVSDAVSGNPMAGVRVQAYNNSLHSTMTKADGSFSLKVPEYVSSLSFSIEGNCTSGSGSYVYIDYDKDEIFNQNINANGV